MNLRKILFPFILLLLTYGFWISPNFKEISAGVAIFLFGMLFLEQGFKAFTWGILEKVLQKSTSNMPKSLLFGFTAATLMQSSSLVSLLTISFLSAQLISFVAALWILFGANLGSTTGAWLIAWFWMKINIAAYAMPMLVFGVLFSFQKTKHLKGIGSILAGLGFLFLGIHYMKEGFETFWGSINLMDYAMPGFAGILVYTFIGIIATILMQSSHATIILVITALATGQIEYQNALALVIGANVGTTITAVIGSLTSNISGKRLALSDVLFKTSTWVLFVLLLPFIIHGVDSLSYILWIGEENYTLKLAVFHTLFNLTGIIIVIPLKKYLITFVTKIFPEKSSQQGIQHALYITQSSIDFPDSALISLILEMRHLYEVVSDGIFNISWISKSSYNKLIPPEELSKKLKFYDIEEIDEYYNKNIKTLFGEILDFATSAQANNDKKYSNEFYEIKVLARSLVEIYKNYKHASKNFAKYAKQPETSYGKVYLEMIQDILNILQDITVIDGSTSDIQKVIEISKLKLIGKRHDILKNGTFNRLIEKEKISLEISTSLLNDTSYKNEIISKLMQVFPYISNKHFVKNTDDEFSTKKIYKWFQESKSFEVKGSQKISGKLRSRKKSMKLKLKKMEKNTYEYDEALFLLQSIELSLEELKEKY